MTDLAPAVRTVVRRCLAVREGENVVVVVDPQTRTIKVRAELNNSAGQFRPEMFATIRLSQGFRPAMVISKSALYQEQDRTTVFRELRRGEFEEIPVTVFWQDNDRAAIRGELHPGDQVVVDGVAQLRAY